MTSTMPPEWQRSRWVEGGGGTRDLQDPTIEIKNHLQTLGKQR